MTLGPRHTGHAVVTGENDVIIYSTSGGGVELPDGTVGPGGGGGGGEPTTGGGTGTGTGTGGGTGGGTGAGGSFVASQTPGPGTTNNAISTSPTVTFAQAMDSGTMLISNVSISLGVAFTVSYNAGTNTLTIDPTSDLATSTTYTVTLSTGIKTSTGVPLPAAVSWSFGTTSGIVVPMSMVGFADVGGTTGGTGGVVRDCTTWTQVRNALQESGTRIIKLHGSNNLNGGGDAFNIDNGNLTLDGTDWTGVIYNTKLVFRASNLIFLELAWRTGEGASSSASADRRCLTFSPGNDPGDFMEKIAIIKCSMAFGPDVIGSFLNDCRYITVQECIIGPSIETSNNVAENPNGYGFNVTVPGNNFADRLTQHGKHITFYRNFMVLCKQRNLKHEHGEIVDAVNNVVYDYGNQAPVHGNAIGANYVSNIFKKGPQTQSSNKAFEENGTGGTNGYAQYANSIYHAGNIGILANGSAFTPDWSDIDAGALRGTPYDAAPSNSSHGSLTIDTANGALFADVVANAGRTYHDGLDNLMRTYATNGTDGGNFYQGVGFGSPNPPVPPI